MIKVIAIAQKEFKSFFRGPIGYVVLFITISVFNLFFFLIIDSNAEATLRDIFKVMEFLFVFIIPLLTMRTVAAERASGTFEFLLTTPVTRTAVVLGKYAGVFLFYTTTLILTLPYYAILCFFSDPDHGAILTGYAGLWLEGGLFIAIGILFSAMTRNQIIAAITSYLVIFMLYFSVSFEKYVSGVGELVLRYIGVWGHSQHYIVGILTLADIVYFTSGIVLCLVLTRFSLLKRS